MKKVAYRVWAARLLIAVVVAWNLECALVFLLTPVEYPLPGGALASAAPTGILAGGAGDANCRCDRGKFHPVFYPGWAYASTHFPAAFHNF